MHRVLCGEYPDCACTADCARHPADAGSRPHQGVEMSDLCALCRQPGRNNNALNKHHIKGKKYPNVMRVHSKTCHWLAQFVTDLYLEAGMESELNENIIIYFYRRAVGLRHGDGPILHPMRS